MLDGSLWCHSALHKALSGQRARRLGEEAYNGRAWANLATRGSITSGLPFVPLEASLRTRGQDLQSVPRPASVDDGKTKKKRGRALSSWVRPLLQASSHGYQHRIVGANHTRGWQGPSWLSPAASCAVSSQGEIHNMI